MGVRGRRVPTRFQGTPPSCPPSEPPWAPPLPLEEPPPGGAGPRRSAGEPRSAGKESAPVLGARGGRPEAGV